jgi:hypothetical protein
MSVAHWNSQLKLKFGNMKYMDASFVFVWKLGSRRQQGRGGSKRRATASARRNRGIL